jgi:hypothetical protein
MRHHARLARYSTGSRSDRNHLGIRVLPQRGTDVADEIHRLRVSHWQRLHGVAPVEGGLPLRPQPFHLGDQRWRPGDESEASHLVMVLASAESAYRLRCILDGFGG